jgi:hypothetical protein
MAWVFKKDYLANSLNEFSINGHNYNVYPNPANNKLFIESHNLNCCEFKIINLFGEIVATGKIDEIIEAIDVSSLSPNVYILKIANKTFRFIKT